LEIFDGKDASFKSLGKYCENHSFVLTTSSNNALLRMKTDVSLSKRGFLLRYAINCNRTIYADSGVIESPNFPNEYPPNLNCAWKIVVSKGNKINLQFTEFDLEHENQTEIESNVGT
jgi:hypothetical protein